MDTQTEAAEAHPEPTNEAVQTDIGFGNQFRLELVKTILTLAPALLAFTIAFRPKLVQLDWEWLMWLGWIGLGLSTLGAMVNMYGWERFYLSYRDFKHNIPAGVAARKIITLWRRAGAVLQFGGFGGGVLAIAVFAAKNLDKLPLAKS